MAASSSKSWRYDVFPSFSGEDVRRGFLSYLLKEFDRRSINSFIDNGIERSRPIGPELISAIREARISVVIFSKNYAASTWCLDELVEIYKSYKELGQMVIPIFYYVDPSDVRKQTGEFGESFAKTCEGKTDDEKKQRWIQSLTDVANLAGEHLSNGPNEAYMVEKIANDVSNKLLSPSNEFGDFVGIEAHIDAFNSILSLDSKDAKMIGIWGQSGIGKSTLGRSLFSHFSPDFHFRNFSTDTPMDKDVSSMKLKWENEFLSEILGQQDLKIENFGEVKKRLNSKKVLIVLDDVVNPEFLKTLAGKTEWFGSGSIIIVITQDFHILQAHGIDLIYEVKIPTQDIALKMLCRNAFAQDSPPDEFREIAVEVAKAVGNLPLGLSVLGSSLKGRKKEEWMEILPELQNGLKGDIMKTLKISYDRLDEEDRDIFLWIAFLFNGKDAKSIINFFGDDKGGVKRLAEKSLIRMTSKEKFFTGKLSVPIVLEMHNLLQKLGRKFVRAESNSNPPGNCRFLTDSKEIQDVLTNQTGTGTVLGISFDMSALESDISIDKKAFQGMFNLQFLRIWDYDRVDRLSLPHGLINLPPKLKWIEWICYPLKCLPSNFKVECLVELIMPFSKLEKLWEGTQKLGSLKTIIMFRSFYLKEIPDLSKAINLERVDFSLCIELKSFPDFSKARRLQRVDFSCCIYLEGDQRHFLNWESLEYLNLKNCHSLKVFPQIEMMSSPYGIYIKVNDSLWNKNLRGLDYLDCLSRFFPTKIPPEKIVGLEVHGTTMEKLCEGVQLLGSLQVMVLSRSTNLKEIPDLSKSTNLVELDISDCESLVTLPSTIRNLQKLEKLEIKDCKALKVLPVNVNLSSLKTLDLRGCSSLKSFPQISSSIQYLYLDYTAIEEVPCLIDMLPRLLKFSMCSCSSLTTFPQVSHSIEELNFDHTSIEEVPSFIEMLPRLTKLSMRGCISLKNISPKIFRMKNLKQADFTNCRDCVIMALSDSTMVATMEVPCETTEKRKEVYKHKDEDPWYFNFNNCFKLDRDARELIIQSSFKSTVILPVGEVPTYFNHRADGNSLIVPLTESSLSQNFLRFNVCVVVKPGTYGFCELYLHFCYDGVLYKYKVYIDTTSIFANPILVLFSFKFQPTCLPSTLDFNNVEFKLKSPRSRRVKEVGIRVLNVSTSLDDRDGRNSEIDVVETERSNTQMQMTSFEENINLPCDQRVTDTGLIASNLWTDSMITEQQDSQLTIVEPDPEPVYTWPSSSSRRASMFSCWGGLLKNKKK